MRIFVAICLLHLCLAKNEEFVPNPACEADRHNTISNFLHAEKGRSFANTIAEWDEIRTDLKHVRWLPVFYEADRHFSHFFLLEGNFTADEANDACQRLDGAGLASLHNKERLEFVSKHLVAGNYWIGLHRWDGGEKFTWADGRDLEGETHWFQDEPKEFNKGFDCVRTVTPTDMICNATYCHSKSFARWSSETCSKVDGFSALCETKYPRPLYGLLQNPDGKFTWEAADKACKSAFGNAVGSGLAMPKSWAMFNNMLNGVNLHFKKWHCWIGLERVFKDNIWMHRWNDGTWSTRNSYQPRPEGQDYSMYPQEHTCTEVYDRYYSAWKNLPEQGWFHYNDCNAELDCAICEWYWPF